jgi:2-methylisocitrate lyase-like PEP mutase family enzyme
MSPSMIVDPSAGSQCARLLAYAGLMSPAEKAAHFRNLHRGPAILVLPNAWDAASARVIEEAGFRAIATTSAGIAFSLGYPDGQRVSRDEMLAPSAASPQRSACR